MSFLDWFKPKYMKEIQRQNAEYAARKKHELESDPLRIRIIESQHFGTKHWNVMVKRPGDYGWFSTNDDYGWDSLDEAEVEVSRWERIARGEIIPYSRRTIKEVEIPQSELAEGN